MKVKLFILLFCFSATLASALYLWHKKTSPFPLYCVGDANWNIGQSRFIGTISWRMYHNEGQVTLTGKILGKHQTYVSRNIYFNYTRKYKSIILHASRVIKTFTDSTATEDISNVLPDFYNKPKGELSLSFYEYQGAYIFSNANVPLLYCRKYAPNI